MRKITRLIKRFKDYITFVILVAFSLVLISIGDVSKLGGFRAVVVGGVGWLQDAFSWIPDTGALKSENKALRELNLQLSNEIIKMRNAVIENKKLRRLLKLKKDIDKEVIAAEVIGKTNIEMRNYYTVNRGKKDGLKMGMAARSDAGLVGVVSSTSENYSLIELITNRNVKISSKFQRTRFRGILVWQGGYYFAMKDVPKSYDVSVGDTVLTSNFSGKYPPEIPIGFVVSVKKLPGDIFARIQVKPFVEFAVLGQVFIIKSLPDPDRLKLIQKMEDKLKERKSPSRNDKAIEKK